MSQKVAWLPWFRSQQLTDQYKQNLYVKCCTHNEAFCKNSQQPKVAIFAKIAPS